ncbi:protein TPR3 [Arabidopsis lyrata subsp. lyrata]|uniref:protein TPR3 n=1 Tax=Arabidopsis lyrata subsp. lyrata TaxID=81972 RepID=UPI000A29B5FC|nr:protein TPR3 [Arabidopsis lyrata subsp. lyrata]XP_020872670.1 protein TPR3 [Arabidopsis lyrata subsp. lyrata]XP_020872671.1 protein TPR3 [Arabidopsis lyrata subsp. lyrata]XP_020872672.1 protein TPR3 [Arabidopsis lyrata subsp. lyrata]|eukprot:XP_020872668.1 protein TPR3 [Arabidopsis lyrata subsp. lyrata]
MDEAGRMRRHDETMTLIKNYLEQHGMSSTVQALDIERGKLPNLATFTSLLLGGNFEDAVTYFCQFQNEVSLASCHIFYFIWRQLFSELLSKNNIIQAKTVFFHRMYPISLADPSLVKDYDELKIHFENNTIPTVDVENQRERVVQYVKSLIEQDLNVRSMFYPTVIEGQSRLQTLLEQSVNWQHRDCVHSPLFASLLNDHHCTPQPLHQNHQTLATNNLDMQASSSGLGNYDPMLLEFNGQPQHSAGSHYSPSLYLTIEDDTVMPGWTINSDQSAGFSNDIPSVVTVPPTFSLSDSVVKDIHVTEVVTAFEFHHHLPLVLVCTPSGGIRLYRINTMKTPFRMKFTIWNKKKLSQALKARLGETEGEAEGLCVAWGSDTTFAVGFSEGLVHTYNYIHEQRPKPHLEIEAHSGPVNDIVFYSSQGELKIVTCGNDRHIKAWNSSNGLVYWKLTHTAPLNSLALHQDGNKVQLFILDVFGTAMKPNIGYNGPLDSNPLLFPSDMNARLELKFSGDGKRLFCYGPGGLVEVDRESFETRRNYNSVMNPQTKCMDICKNGYIAVGDEYCVKVWNVDSDHLFRKIKIDAAVFPECPMVKFNREGSLLAVVSSLCLRFLANADGKSLLEHES